MAKEEHLVEVNITPSEEAFLILAGFWIRGDDGILELTDEGNSFVQDFITRKKAEYIRRKKEELLDAEREASMEGGE